MSSTTKKPRSTKLFALLALCLCGLFMASACTPEEVALVVQAKSEEQRAVLASYNDVQRSLSDAQLARLANCESGGNPAAVSRNGKYRGLYQFNQGTWNSTAQSVLPGYVGVSPSIAPPEVQHAMARALYAARGRSPWPICGRRI